jgi:hypothetical protein
MTIAVEEVVAHDGEPGVRRDAEEMLGLLEQPVPVRVRSDGSDPDPDGPLVVTVKGAHDRAVAVRGEDLDGDVPPTQQCFALHVDDRTEPEGVGVRRPDGSVPFGPGQVRHRGFDT